MIFNEKAYEEVYPRVAPQKVLPKKESIMPDDEDDLQEDAALEVEAPEEIPDPEEGQAEDESGTGDTIS